MESLPWLIKFYEGGVTYDSIMNMPLDELGIIINQSAKIARYQRDGK